MAEIDLEYYKTRPDEIKKLRLVDYPSKRKTELKNMTGANLQIGGAITYPPNPIHYYRLNTKLDYLVPSTRLKYWISDFERFTKNQIEIKEQGRDDFSLSTEGLYDFQKKDVYFMLNGGRVLNCNGMGSGKTVESIALLNELPKSARVLVVASRSLLYMWAQELSNWYNKSSNVKQLIIVPKGTQEQRRADLRQDSKFTLINYAMLRNNKYPQLFSREWDVVIADEAHKLKNRNTLQTKGFSKLKAKRMLLLTGTPIPNSPEEIFSLLNLIQPNRFKSYWQFVDDFCRTEFSPYKRQPDIIGTKNKKEFDFLLSPLMLQRKKEDIMPELPEKRHQVIKLEMTQEQRELYDELDKDMFTIIGDRLVLATTGLTKRIRLNQIALSPKLLGADIKGIKIQAIKDILQDKQEKVVIFSKSAQFIHLLEEELDYKSVKVTGEQDAQERREAELQFQNDGDTMVFLGTIHTAGEGFNLQVSSTVIFADKDWSPKINEQCEDRVHRDGQTDSPLIISLVCENSVDEDLEERVETKNEIITTALDLESMKEKILNWN